MTFIQVRHNIEVAHRLFDMKGKCEAIHGHSMWVELRLHGQLDSHGVLDGLEFGSVKKRFREHLDGYYDHRLLLNQKDPWTAPLYYMTPVKLANPDGGPGSVEGDAPAAIGHLPGLRIVKGDPTTENIAKWVAQWATDMFERPADVIVHETAVNAAGFSMRPGGGQQG